MGGAALTILNAADEEAVHLFLQNEIKFLDIVYLCELALKNISNIIEPSFDELESIDIKTREWIKANKEDL